MTPIARPRGPLPARVYWTRRLLLLAVVLGLVFGAARLLGGSGDAGGGPSATPVAADPTSTPTTSAPTPSLTPSLTPTPTAGSPVATPSATGGPSSALAAPSGTCKDGDVVVVPSVASPAYSLRPVVIALTLTTKLTEACTFEVSPAHLVVKVTSGDTRFWSTQDCEGVVPKQVVVVRRAAPTIVSMTWNGLSSDAECSRSTSWAYPGSYRVMAATLGGDPTEVQFRLFRPVRETITATPTPTPTPSGSATRTPSASPSR